MVIKMEITFNIVICDDEINFLELIYTKVKNITERYNYLCEIIDFDNSNEFIRYCKKNIVDIILIDIDMPSKDGFAAVKELQEHQPDIGVIFVSAHEELAYQAFKCNPYQFVSKADLGRLDSVLIELIFKIKHRKESQDIIHININNDIININVKDTVYLLKEKNYISVYGEHDVQIQKFRGILKSVYEQLSDHGFICTNRSCIINCRFIRNFERKKVILLNGKEIKGTRKAIVIDEAQRLYGKFKREQRW